MTRDPAHWLIEDSDYYDSPESCIEDVFDCEDTLEVYNEETDYESMIP